MPTAAMPALRAISSMATRALLTELLAQRAERLARRAEQGGAPVELESVGGVDAARRVAAGEPFDLVIIADEALRRLAAQGHVEANAVVPLVHSAMAVAAPADAPVPRLNSEADLREAVRSATAIGYSTGPSGQHLLNLIERWGLTAELKGRILQAPPGVPVASMAASGQVALAFQQLVELQGVAGTRVLGTLPGEAAFVTTFSGAALLRSARQAEAAQLLAALAAADAAATKRRHGMEPA